MTREGEEEEEEEVCVGKATTLAMDGEGRRLEKGTTPMAFHRRTGTFMQEGRRKKGAIHDCTSTQA